MLQIGQGATSPSDWKNYSTLGIYVDVDTSGCGFKEIPHYIPTLHGKSGHWCANGVTSIYNETTNGFRIYLRWTDDNGHYGNHNPLRASFARKNGWYIKWTGVKSCECKKRKPTKKTVKKKK